MNIYSLFRLVSIPTGYLLLFSLGCSTGWSQTTAPGAYKALSTIRNVLVYDTLTGMGLDVSAATPLPRNGKVQVQAISGGGSLPLVNRIRYTPNPGFIGTDTFAVALNYLTSYPFLTFQIYRVTVRPSIVTAQPDYAVTTSGQPVIINVLANDRTTTSGNLIIRSLPGVNYGTAVLNASNQIVFTPKAGFTGIAHLNYTACDALNTCQAGQVMIGVSNGNAVNDTLQVATAKNRRIFMPLTRNGYSIFTPPASGNLSVPNGYAFYYTPNNNFTGSDPFVLVIGTGSAARYKTVQMRVLNTPVANTMAIDDEAATPVNQSVTFNVKNNDIGNLTVKSWIPPAATQGSISNTNTAGKVTFNPAPGFSGVATFGYVLGNLYAPNVETGRVQVAVGNQDPITRTYNLTTPATVPLVINYKVPFNNFSFTVSTPAKRGSVTYYPGQTTQVINNQNIKGYNLLIYNPALGYTGLDSFTVLYCITPNGTCTSTRIRVSVVNVPSNATPCQAGCVWPGDANNDGIVNNKDLLTTGYLPGAEGTPRTASNQWFGQSAAAWADPFTELKTDLKHADSDGSGRITSPDTTATLQYYGRTPALKPLVYTLGNPLPFALRNLTPNPKKGDKVQVEVLLGTEANPVVNLRSFTFDVSLSSQIRDSALRMEFYPNSWLNMNSPVIWMQKSPRRGRLETALARTGDLLGHGSGAIGRFEFIVIDIIDGGKPGSELPYFTITIDQSVSASVGNRSETGATYTLKIPLVVPNKPTVKKDFAISLIAYPSPASDQLHLEMSNASNMQTVSITDITGKTVYFSDNDAGHSTLHLSTQSWPSGLYFIAVKTEQGCVNKKVEVAR